MTGGTVDRPVVVTLPAEIDLTSAPAVTATLLEALGNPGLVIVDMTGTTFCDSAGLRMLMIARDRARDNAATLRIIVRPEGSVARALAILGMDRVLPIYPSLRDAMPAQAGVGGPAP